MTTAPAFRETRLRKKEEKARQIDRTFHEYEEWVRDSMTTEDQPYSGWPLYSGESDQ